MNYILHTLEDIVMVSACFLKIIALMLVISSIIFYIYYVDGLFSISIIVLGFFFLGFSYMFYIKSINTSRDVLLNILEKKGRKELQIDEDIEAIRLFKKVSSCSLPDEPANAKEFQLTILYLGKDQLTIYTSCPKSHIFKIHKKKVPGKMKTAPVEACGESREYYYSYIQSIEFKGDITITLNSGHKEVLKAAKAPAKATVNKIRKILRKTESNWIEHSRGSHNITRDD